MQIRFKREGIERQLKDDSIYLSIVVPIRDEEANIEPLAEEISQAISSLNRKWECIWVDDGSTDGSLSALRSLHDKDQHHLFLSLDRNYGQSTALVAGFRVAKGAIIATLDGDGQNDPADLPALVMMIESREADMVNGVRMKRRDTLARRLSSQIANGFRNWLTREKISDVGCSVRAFRRECLEELPLFEGMHRFLPTLIRMKGWKITEVPVNHRPRSRGKTKYGIHNRLWVGLLDLFAVRWMQSRLIHFKVKEASSGRED
ncbi:MAG: glycosyltransferase family 2 protein [Candidatus Tectomicrobia bacterium]|nr:glycosyltransferase family 2 protein [Candidatus Tectomicrobia bacterium]